MPMPMTSITGPINRAIYFVCVHFFVLPKPPTNAKQRAPGLQFWRRDPVPLPHQDEFPTRLKGGRSPAVGHFAPAPSNLHVMPNRLERKSLGERVRLCGNGG